MDKLNKIKNYIENKIDFPKNKTFEGFYNAGVDAYEKQDYENAINYFKLAIEQSNIQPQVYYNLALSHQCLKEYDRAIVAYNKFLEANPADYDGLYNIALIYFNKENYAKSIYYFKKCLEIKNEEDVIKGLVLAYLSNNQIQNAVDFSLNILENHQNGIDLYYALAKIFENKNSFSKDFTLIDKAIEMYLKIIEKDSKYFNAYLSISICYAKKGVLEKSVDYCDKAVELNPQSYEANNQMGLVFYCCNEVQKAVDYYEIALNLKPEGDYKIYSNLAYAYEKNGQYDKAIKLFAQLLEKFPEFPAKDEIKNHLRILKAY